MKINLPSDIPILEPEKNGYYEIYEDGSKIWHKNEYPPKSMKLKPPSDFVIAGQDVKTDDLITFLDEGKYNTLPQDPSREVLTFRVKIPSGDEKSLSVNKSSQIELIKAWTNETSKWKGKQTKVKIVTQQVFKELKDVIYLYPAEGKVVSSPPKTIGK